MFQKLKSFIRFDALSALGWICALCAVAIFLPGCVPAPIPVTSAEKADKPAIASQAQRSVDLGAGYRMESNSQGTRIVAPETVIRAADKTFDLGAGYRLVITSNGEGEIVPPARLNTDVQRVDLGGGYVLETANGYGRIIPPASTVKSGAQPVTEQREYIGGGYWLITGPDGGRVVPEGTK